MAWSLKREYSSKAGVSIVKAAAVKDLTSANILLMLGEFDLNEIVDGNLIFVEEYRKKFSRLPLLEVMKKAITT